MRVGRCEDSRMARSWLRVVSRGRQEPLTDAETVRLGRRLVALLGVEHVSYPDGHPTTVVEIWGAREPLRQEATDTIEAVIGPIDVSVMEK